MSKAPFLVLSDLFPTVQRPFGAPFISERLTAHANSGYIADRIDLRLTPKQPLRALLSRAGRDVQDPPPGSSPFVGLDASITDYVRLQRAHTRRPWALEIADKIESICTVGNYRAIHAHGMYRVGAGLVAAVLSERHNVPFAVTAHGSDINVGMPAHRQEFVRTFSAARSVMYVSPALRDRAIELGAPWSGSIVTGNGVDLEAFSRGAPDRGPVLLYVGNLVEVKGADRLPKIFRKVRAVSPDATMTVIGVGPLHDRIKAECGGLPVTFLGAQNRVEVAAAMRRAAVLVLPSRNEGWPTVINEALASGTPVVATDVGGVRHALGHDEWVVSEDPAPEVALSELVSSLLTADIDRAGLREQASQHSWSAIARRERAALGID